MTQPSLFDAPSYRAGTSAGFARGSDTSAAAAAHADRTLGDRQRAVLDTLRRLGQATGEEIAHQLRRPTYTVLPRLTEMAKQGLVVDTGKRRENVTGRKATVWSAA